MMKSRFAKKGVATIRELLDVARETGVRLIACQMTMEVFGYRVGPVGYVTDAKALPDAAIERLRGVRVLVLNALFDRPHPTHLSIPEAIEVARAVGAERTLLTHLTHRHLHAALAARLPPGIEPAYDGLTVTF